MEGFFTRKEVESISRPDGKLYTCVSCGLYKNVKSPKMKPYGNFRKKIMIVGEAPGEVEDTKGKPWQGKTGLLLQRTCKSLGVDLFEDCVNINACHCRPSDDNDKNRPPTNLEIDSCRKTTLQYIQHYKPKLIILLGTSALYSLIGYRWKRDLSGISKWRGFTIPDQDFKTWVVPTFHPSFVERDETEVAMTVWTQDLRKAFSLIDVPVPMLKQPTIKIITDLSILDSIVDGLVAIDYETTGIKPHAAGHKIVSTAVAVSDDLVYAFLMPKSRTELQPLIRLLDRETVGKIAHNMKFEEAWSRVRLRQPVRNWIWDTMLAAHLIDNRTGVTSLKFQAFVMFGVPDYESEVSSYLSSKEDGANAMNQILEFIKTREGTKTLLTYNAWDAIHEYRLARKQMELFEEVNLPF